jgi:hypothetical protein
LILVIVVGGAALLFFRLERDQPEPPLEEPPAVPEGPAIRHPVEPPKSPGDPAGPPVKPLPPLAESDPAMRDALSGLFGSNLERIFNLKDSIRRFVVTVDNLPRDQLPVQLSPVKPLAGLPVTTGKGENLALSRENAARYQRYVRLAEMVPTGPMVAVYVRFYPLFQQQYEKLGYPGQYFNDRLVQVIDHLLAAPEVEGPLRLVQPRVLYQFADPKLESLSAGQKIMLRMGPENSAKVKAKLREIRREVARQAP